MKKIPRKQPQRRGLMDYLGWVLKFALGLFVGVHIYALVLKAAPVPGTVLMAQRAIGGEQIQRKMVSIDDISPNLVLAVIAAEDTRFCQHTGVDREAIEKAISEYQRGKGLRGASTITQQTAKNVFLWNGGGFARKGAEAWFATFIDGMWGKRRVMEAYLNVAEWGDGVFGAEAAAEARFGKSAADLTEREAALLAAVLPSPNKWRLDPPGPYVSKRAGTLQARMRVVRSEGLASCVLDEQAVRRSAPRRPAEPQPTAPQETRPEVRPETPAARPTLPDLPPPPEEGAGDAPQDDAATETPDEFDSFLQDAEDRFGQETMPAPEPPPESAPEPGPEETDPETDSGPADLRPQPLDPE
ncbi:monofunctional biosynthetic peptidoglycan transglycosylase [Hyphomonas sp.]|uniref:monofunctional biosynthetic peptidoglycan transglycosylase n=1 Tax=Hyphomonas sp. TaxID=87 RepID=UPI003242A91C